MCEVEETGNGGATSVTYAGERRFGSSGTVPTPTIVAGETQTVAVTNTFIEVGGEFSGRVNIEKKITGVPPAEGTQFVVNVSCTGPTVSVDEDVTLTYSSQLTGSVAFNAPSDETVTCTVTEKDPLGGAVSASIGPNNGVVVVTVEAPVADVVVTNHYGEPPVEVQGLVVTDTLPFTGSSTDVLLKSGAWLVGHRWSVPARVVDAPSSQAHRIAAHHACCSRPRDPSRGRLAHRCLRRGRYSDFALSFHRFPQDENRHRRCPGDAAVVLGSSSVGSPQVRAAPTWQG